MTMVFCKTSFKTKFKDKVVFITGASSGIGAALAVEVAKQGATIVLTARRLDRLRELELKLQDLGAKTLSIQADVTSRDEQEHAIKQTINTFGRIDVVFANAGFGVVGNVESMHVDDFRRQFETNVFGLINTVYACIPALKKSQGTLALIGSVTSYISLPGASPYAMSKFCVRALANSLYHELKPMGVAVTLINPGFVESELRQVDNHGNHKPGGQERLPWWLVMSTPKAAKQILCAVACRKKEVVITWHGKVLVLLERHLPWLLTFVVGRLGLRGRREPKT